MKKASLGNVFKKKDKFLLSYQQESKIIYTNIFGYQSVHLFRTRKKVSINYKYTQAKKKSLTLQNYRK